MATPWTKIKAEWLKGGTSYKKLAEKYGIKEQSIKNRAYKEGWKNQKVQIADKVSTELCARVAHTRVNHLERLINASELIITGLEKLAAEVAADPVKYLQDKSGSLRSAESITKALQTATETQRDLYRLPNIDQKFAAKKWRDQLKLEQAKQKDSQESDQETWVIRAPEGEELDG